MSGSGRKSSYRKTITDSVLYGDPEPGENESIVKVVSLKGSNLMEVKDEQGVMALAMLPQKFRKLIWVKRGDFLIVASATSDITVLKGKKGAVKYCIQHILYKEQIKDLKRKQMWPSSFHVEDNEKSSKAVFNELSEKVNDDIFVNRNRMGRMHSDSEEESD